MNVISRGIRNAFRNTARTISVVSILGAALGLCLVMLVANQVVDAKIKKTLQQIGTTIVVSPAGFSSGASVSTALAQAQADKLDKIAHISSTVSTLTSQLQTEGTSNSPTAKPDSASGASSTSEAFKTSLKSPFTFDCDDGICSGGSAAFRSQGGVSGPKLPDNFSIPISVIGTDKPDNPRAINTNKLTIADGKPPASGQREAMISRAMADKNKLAVGSTFKAYDTDIRISGLFESDTRMGDSTVIMPLDTLQELSLQKDIITQIIVTVDSLANLQSATDDIKRQLGTSADVASRLDEANAALAPLQSVKQISFYSLMGAMAAGAVTLSLVMVMIVRERKREIGILKAIGFGGVRITGQFVVESLTITLLSLLVGITIGVAAVQPVALLLVDNAQDAGYTNNSVYNGATIQALQDVKFAIGPQVIFIGLVVVVLIALFSSIAATLFITKIKPAEVLRGE